MRLQTRLRTLEATLRPAEARSPLRIVLVDEQGRWWEYDEEIDPGTRIYLLRYLATEIPRCA